MPSLDTGKAILVQSTWNINEYREFHDIVIPPILGPPGGEIWVDSPYMLPARRKYLLSFQGFLNRKATSADDSYDISRCEKLIFIRLKLQKTCLRYLFVIFFLVRDIHEHLTSTTSDDFYLDLDCSLADQNKNFTSDEWRLCKSEKERADVLKESTFALIPCTLNSAVLSTATFLTRLFESLKYGSIPIILGSDYITLPFNEVVEWNMFKNVYITCRRIVIIAFCLLYE